MVEVFWRFRYAGRAGSAVPTCLKPYCATQITGPLAHHQQRGLPGIRYTLHAGVVEGSRPLSKINRTPGQASGAVVLVWLLERGSEGVAAATESQISNPQIQPSSSQSRTGSRGRAVLGVSAARKGGLQTIQAENINLGVDCCTCCSCLVLYVWLETRRAGWPPRFGGKK